MHQGPDTNWRENRFGYTPFVLLVFLALLPVWISSIGSARSPDAHLGMPVAGSEKTRILEDLQQRQKSLVSMSASVQQRKHHPLLRDDLESKGIVNFHKPNLVRWEVRTPEHRILVMDGNQMTTFFPDRLHAIRVDLQDQPSARMVLEAFSIGLSAPFKDLERRFNIELYRDDPLIVLKLTPRSKWLSRALSSILIYHKNGEVVPRRVIVTGTRGERSETMLQDVRINPIFAPGTFELKFGPEIQVDEPDAARTENTDGE